MGNGSIDFKEFICALSITSRGRLDEKLRWAFQLYDINGDGTITYNEMLTIVRAIYKMTGEMVQLPPDEDTPEKVHGNERRLTPARRQNFPSDGPRQELGAYACAQ